MRVLSWYHTGDLLFVLILQYLPLAAVEMVPKKTVEQSVDTEGIARECPVSSEEAAWTPKEQHL